MVQNLLKIFEDLLEIRCHDGHKQATKACACYYNMLVIGVVGTIKSKEDFNGASPRWAADEAAQADELRKVKRANSRSRSKH